jgi:ElaB/YqjD/DUF883 family membrane-anchored ribosome-binding protein
MYKTKSRNKDYDISGDLRRVQQALKDTARDVSGKTSDMFSQSIDTVREQSTNLQTGVADLISDKPFKTMAVALLSGWTIGYLMQRRTGRYRRTK